MDNENFNFFFYSEFEPQNGLQKYTDDASKHKQSKKVKKIEFEKNSFLRCYQSEKIFGLSWVAKISTFFSTTFELHNGLQKQTDDASKHKHPKKSNENRL